MTKQYEYREMMYLNHARQDALDRLNEAGRKGWAPAFAIGRTLVLVREMDGDAPTEATRPEATVDDWREVYEAIVPGALAEMDAETVGEIMEGKGFALPTRTTLGRWADEARKTVSEP